MSATLSIFIVVIIPTLFTKLPRPEDSERNFVVVVVLPSCFRGMAASYVQRGHKRIILNTEVLLA